MSDEINVVTSEIDDAVQPEAEVEKKEEQGKQEEQEPQKEEKQENPEPTAKKEGAEPSKPKKSGAEKRIATLTYKAREAERKEEAARKKVTELEAQLAAVKPPALDEKPKYEDFEDDESYNEALTNYTVKRAIAEAKVADTETELTSQKETATQELETAQTEKDSTKKESEAALMATLEEAKEFYPDFDEVVRAKDLAITPQIIETVMDADNPAEILYALGKDPERTAEIAQLSPARMAMELGRLDIPRKVEEKQTTKAPSPINPVKPSPSAVRKNPDDMTMEEYRAWREKT